MYLKKIRNNNRGADVAFIGTNYLLVLIVVCCAILDLTIIEYSKMSVVSLLKQCEMYALAKHYDNEQMWNGQQVILTQSVEQNIRHTFVKSFIGACESSNFLNGVSLADNTQNVSSSGVTVNMNTQKDAIMISVPKVHFSPRKLLNTNRTAYHPFLPHFQLGFKAENMEGDSEPISFYETIDSKGAPAGSSFTAVTSHMTKNHAVAQSGDMIRVGAACKIVFIRQGPALE